jgi:hypothetical protein
MTERCRVCGSQPNRSPPPRRAAHVAALVGAIWSAALATQYVAARLAYHPHLGPWVYRASAADQSRLKVVMVLCVVAGGIASMSRRWRWGVVPLSFAAITGAIARSAPLYSPERVFVWYTAYHRVRAYHGLFIGACIIFGVASIAATLAALRLCAGELRPTPTPLPRLPPASRFNHDPSTLI